MRRPLRVKILGKVYRIRVITERAEGFEEGDYGQCDDDKQLISLIAGRSLGNDQDTLLHELIHAICFQMNVADKMGKHEEAVVQAIATGLLAVLKDNRGLVSYLRSK